MYFLFGLEALPDLVRYMEVETRTGLLACGSTRCWDATPCWDAMVGDFSGLSCL